MSRERQLIDFLSQKKSYPYKADYIKIIQTHISIIAVAPPFVYKFKKGINFGFIDYSTFEKRRENVFKEFTLNKRLCENIYEEIVKVYFQDSVLSFEKGDLFEYGIKMKYLKTENCLQEITRSGNLSLVHIKLLAKTLKEFYVKLNPEYSGFGSPDVVKSAVLGNFEVVEKLLDKGDAFKTDFIKKYSTAFLETHKEYIQNRVKQGWVRDCHGDLRLEHIYFQTNSEKKSVCIYDCIEFNDHFRFIDIANDLAFLSMDFDYNQKPTESNLLMQMVLEQELDKSLMELFWFFKCYRAYVRVKVNMLRACEDEVPEKERASSARDAKRYLALSLRYALLPLKPVVIQVMGKVGTGKTTVARYIADAFDIPHLNSDYIRKTMVNLDPYKPSEKAKRKELYSTEFTQKTYSKLFLESLKVLKQGLPVVIDATFSKKEIRNHFRDEFDKEGFACITIETTASRNVINGRLKSRVDEKNNTSDATMTEKEFMDASYESPKELTGLHYKLLDTSPSETSVWQRELFEYLSEIHRQNYLDIG